MKKLYNIPHSPISEFDSFISIKDIAETTSWGFTSNIADLFHRGISVILDETFESIQKAI